MSTSALPRILCVDDDPNLLAGLANTLRRRFDVTTAANGPDALRIVADAGPFDVIVSDYRMPGMDGAEFLRRARQLAPTTVPVLLTGHATLEGAIAAVNEGRVFRILLKPCPPEILIGAIDEAVAQALAPSLERRRYEEEIEGLSGELQEAARLATAGRLASGFGHEINNMVAVLDGTIAGIRDATGSGGALDPEDIAALSHVRKHLATHGKNLMRLGRPQRTVAGTADLGRAVQDAVAMLKETGPLKRAKVVVEVAATPTWVGLAETPLEQILLNLIKNASEAVTTIRTRIPTITVAVTTDNVIGMATCTVADDGVGIPAADMDRLFEAYHTTKPVGSGTGLGLFVVRHIVETAGGRVTAQSREGQGSTFTFTVPLRPAP